MRSELELKEWVTGLAVVAVSLTALLPTGATAAKALEDRKWIEVKSEHFTIRSAIKEKDTIELAEQLELFRAAVGIITNISAVDAAVPINIYVVRKANDFKAFGIENDVAGLIKPGIREYTVLVRDVRGMQETSTIAHEYVHFLLRNHSKLYYPKWFDEGFAEYLSASARKRGQFQIGLVPEHRVTGLQYTNWLKFESVIDSEPHAADWSDQQGEVFYGQSWALTHYLQNELDDSVSFSSRMDQYIAIVEQTGSHVEAFEAAFGIGVDEVHRRITRYLGRGRFNYFSLPEKALLEDIPLQIRAMSREEAALNLGQVALRFGQFERAEQWFAMAATATALAPALRAQAEAGLGDVRKFEGDYDQALPHYERALELGAGDPLVQLDVGEYWHRQACEGTTLSRWSNTLSAPAGTTQRPGKSTMACRKPTR